MHPTVLRQTQLRTTLESSKKDTTREKFLKQSKIKRLDRLELIKDILKDVTSEEVYSCFKQSLTFMVKALRYEDF